MRKINFVFIILFSLVVSIDKVFAWGSVEIGDLTHVSTHYKLTRLAIDQIPDDYPDIKKFKEEICVWTAGTSDDANAHGKKYNPEAGKYNGGPYQRWWDNPPNSEFKNDGVLVRYKLRNFVNGGYSAYYYLAMMCHLIADQAVPAHAANIYHAGWNFDNLELYAYSYLSPTQGAESVIKNDASILDILRRYYYYFNNDTQEKDGSIFLTQGKLSSWKSSDNRNYWREHDSANVDDNYKYKGDAFYNIWGYYGGVNKEDIFYGSTDAQDIIPTQYLQSIAYMAGFLESVSKSLPPLVSNLKLANNTITDTNPTVISFLVEENRTEYAKVKITVDGEPVKDSDKRVWDGETERWLGRAVDETLLPFQFSFNINWDGLLADETYPTDGQHDLVVMAQDADGNWSDSCGVSFVIDRSPPEDDTMAPEIKNLSPVGTINITNPIIKGEVIDALSGVEKVEFVLKEEGTILFQGVPTLTDIPAGKSFSYTHPSSLSSDSYGYIVKAQDKAGNTREVTRYFTIRVPTDFVIAIQTSKPWFDPFVLEEYKSEATRALIFLEAGMIEGDTVSLIYFSNGAIGVAAESYKYTKSQGFQRVAAADIKDDLPNLVRPAMTCTENKNLPDIQEKLVNGEKLIYKGQYLEADAELGYVLSEITKEESNSREKLIQNILISRVYYDLGEIQYQQGKYEKARPYFEKAVNQPVKSYWEARAFYRLGLIEYNMKNYKEARGRFCKVVSEYSTSEEAPEAQYYMGLSYNLDDDEENARQSFKKFLCLFPNHPWINKVREKVE